MAGENLGLSAFTDHVLLRSYHRQAELTYLFPSTSLWLGEWYVSFVEVLLLVPPSSLLLPQRSVIQSHSLHLPPPTPLLMSTNPQFDPPVFPRRYTAIGSHDGAPRFRNPNNIFLFRHGLKQSEDIGITRRSCLPVEELAETDAKSTSIRSATSLSTSGETPDDMGTDFLGLVKASLQTVRLERQARWSDTLEDESYGEK